MFDRIQYSGPKIAITVPEYSAIYSEPTRPNPKFLDGDYVMIKAGHYKGYISKIVSSYWAYTSATWVYQVHLIVLGIRVYCNESALVVEPDG